MKTRLLLLTLLVPTAAVLAADPPKLVPRPIPGLSSATLAQVTAPSQPTATQPPVPILTTNPDRARILYIHRRSTLPADLTKDLPASRAAPTASATLLNVRQGAVKIIPKAQVAQIITPKS